MVTLLRRLLTEHRDRVYFASVVVLAANAGGAWSPIGDVTTTMLWIGGQISAAGIIGSTFLPSVVSLAVPLVVLSYRFDGRITAAASPVLTNGTGPTTKHQRSMLLLGLGALLFVPLFKTITHLPPYMGMLISLGIL